MVQTPDQAEKDSDAQSWGPAGLETWPSGRESGLPGRWLCGLGAPVAPPAAAPGTLLLQDRLPTENKMPAFNV